VVLLYDLFFW
jgi:hypothetical protein